MRMYICVLDEFPDYMTPTLVAHAVLGAHLQFHLNEDYQDWLKNSFKKCVVRVNQKEFEKIAQLPINVYLAHENHTLEARKACAVVHPMPNDKIPNVLKFAKLWKPASTVIKEGKPTCSVCGKSENVRWVGGYQPYLCNSQDCIPF